MNYKEEVLKIYPDAIIESYVNDSGIKLYYLEDSDYTIKSWICITENKVWSSAWKLIQREFLKKLNE